MGWGKDDFMMSIVATLIQGDLGFVLTLCAKLFASLINDTGRRYCIAKLSVQ